MRVNYYMVRFICKLTTIRNAFIRKDAERSGWPCIYFSGDINTTDMRSVQQLGAPRLALLTSVAPPATLRSAAYPESLT